MLLMKYDDNEFDDDDDDEGEDIWPLTFLAVGYLMVPLPPDVADDVATWRFESRLTSKDAAVPVLIPLAMCKCSFNWMIIILCS